MYSVGTEAVRLLDKAKSPEKEVFWNFDISMSVMSHSNGKELIKKNKISSLSPITWNKSPYYFDYEIKIIKSIEKRHKNTCTKRSRKILNKILKIPN